MPSIGPGRRDFAGASRGRWRSRTCPGLFLLYFVSRVAMAQADSTIAEDDSLQLRLLGIESERFRLEAEHTNLWHRLIPAVHLSAGFGWKNLLILDPSTLTLSTLPRDAYRLTIGISLNEVLDGSKHSAAELELEKIDAMRDRLRERAERSRFELGVQFKSLDIERNAALQERAILEEILRFDGMRFGQGKIGYDALMQSRLRLVDLERRLKILSLRSDEVQRKLTGGGVR